MQLTRFADLALRVLAQLTVSRDVPVSARDIAATHGAPFNHVAKVAQWLAAEGYVVATRGRGGGMRLAQAPEAISLGAVVRAAEQGTALVECFREDGGACALSPACGLAPILSEAQEAFYATLDRHTLADMTRRRPGMVALLKRLSPDA